MKKRIGLFGGSFNPIHYGHINLAFEMLEHRKLDHIYFCPASLNPHKKVKDSILSTHRLAMLKEAIKGIPEFSIIENELFRPQPSYTIETIEELIFLAEKERKNAQFFLIIGADVLPHFHLWRRAHDIIKRVSVLVGMRSGCPIGSKLNPDPVINEALCAGLTFIRLFDISSTEIRDRIAHQKYCGHLLPAKVLDYIYSNRLY